MTRAYLLVLGAMSAVIGLAYIIRPVEMIAVSELEPRSATAILDVQGFYGGQLLGLGVAMLLCLRGGRLVAGLVLGAAPLGGTAVGRLYGVVTSGTCPPIIAVLSVVEIVAAGVGLALLRGELRRDRMPRA